MKWKTILACVALAALPMACDSDGDAGDTGSHDTDDSGETHDDEDTELISTITLTFTSEAGDTVTASFTDDDGDGGASGIAEPIELSPDTTYSLTVQFLNELEDPSEDITEEVREEAEDHQVFFYGASVNGPASDGDGVLTHAYADLESDYGENLVGDDLPLGLSNTLTTGAAATDGELRVMLRHLPDLNGAPQKTSDLGMLLSAGDALPGEADADVRFDVSVQ